MTCTESCRLYLFVEVEVVTESDVDYGSDREQVGEERVVLFRMRQDVLFHYLYLQPIIVLSLLQVMYHVHSAVTDNRARGWDHTSVNCVFETTRLISRNGDNS